MLDKAEKRNGRGVEREGERERSSHNNSLTGGKELAHSTSWTLMLSTKQSSFFHYRTLEP